MNKKNLFFMIFLSTGILSYSSASRAMMLLEVFRSIFSGAEAEEMEDLKKQNERFPKKKILIGDNEIITRSRIYKGKHLCQLRVLNQFEVDGGGASCGYQTLKNGIVMALALLKKDIPECIKKCALKEDIEKSRPRSLQTKLKDIGLVQQFFGNIHSLWRERVILGRTADMLNAVLKQLWKKNVHIPKVDASYLKKDKVAAFYAKILDGLATTVAQDVVFQKKSFSFDVSGTQEQLFELCKLSCQRKMQDDVNDYYTGHAKGKTKDDLLNLLCAKERLVKYVDFEELKKITVSPKNYLKLINENELTKAHDRTLDGDWLDGNEVEDLIKYERKNGMLKEIKNISWLVYEDVSLIGKKGFDANEKSFLQAIKKATIDPSHIVVFCIGTMRNSSTRLSGSLGHWFPLVWTRDRNYIMDSSSNQCRLEDNRVEKVLDAFEGLRKSFKDVVPKGTCSVVNRVPGPICTLQYLGVIPKPPVQKIN